MHFTRSPETYAIGIAKFLSMSGLRRHGGQSRSRRRRFFSDLSLGQRPNDPRGWLSRFHKEMTAKNMDEIGAIQRAELYYELHPRSPSAVRLPKLFVRSGVWVALLGRSVRDGIAGFGPTIEAALRAFDAQYLDKLRPPSEGPTLDAGA